MIFPTTPAPFYSFITSSCCAKCNLIWLRSITLWPETRGKSQSFWWTVCSSLQTSAEGGWMGMNKRERVVSKSSMLTITGDIFVKCVSSIQQHRITTKASITSQYQFAFGIMFHILWYVVIILNRTPSQHLTGLIGRDTHSCQLSLKQKHISSVETKLKTGASIWQK